MTSAWLRTISLRTRLMALVVFASVIPVVLLAAIEFRAARALLRRSAVDLLSARAEHLAAQIDAFHASFERATHRMALLPSVIGFLELPQRTEGDVRAVEGVLKAYVETDKGRVHGAGLFDRQGRIVATTETPLRGNVYSYRRYFQVAIAGRRHISDVYVAATEAGSVPLIAYASPVGPRGNPAGVAVMFARAASFWDLVRSGNGSAGEGSYSVVYDADGVRIAHSFHEEELFRPAGPLPPDAFARIIAEKRFGDRTRELLEHPLAAPIEARLIRDPTGDPVFSSIAPATGEPSLSVARRLVTVPWTLFYRVPERTLAEPVRALMRDNVATGGLMLAFALLFGTLLARSITEPLVGLMRAADAVRAGDVEAKAETAGRDEISRLGRAFNEMVASVRDARENLERKVRDRTAALDDANRALFTRNTELSEQTQRLEQEQARDAAYARVLAALAAEGELRPVVEAALREACAISSAPLLACFRVEGETAHPIAAVGTSIGEAPRDLPLGGLGREALRTGKVAVFGPLPADATFRFDAVLFEASPQALALVPLSIGARRIGLLVAAAPSTFGEVALAFLADVAVPLALTIARHELHAQTQRDSLELSNINEELRLQADELRLQRQELEVQRAALERTTREVQRADQLKSEFLANMSHELRTPLNAIVGFSELMVEEPEGAISEEHRRYARDVLSSARHLLALINEILDLAKIEAGRLELQLEAVDAAELVAEAVQLVRPQAAKKSMVVTIAAPGGLAVHGDRGKLKQVLVNLCSNAVKFGPERSSVAVAAELRDGAVRFSVRDEGAGIDDRLRERLFEPFVQGENALVKRHQGTGLGLAISKRLVEAHGGAIGIDSKPGAGSSFWFTIPLDRKVGPGARSRPRTDDATPGSTRGAAILIVDEDDAALRLLDEHLVGAGYRAARAATPAGAVATARRIAPAAVLLDLDLPSGGGLAALRALKADPATRHIPVIIVSILAEEQRGVLLDAADFLTKPADPRTLLATLARHVGPSAAAGKEPLATVLLVDDDPSVADVLRPAVADAGYRLVTAATGGEGVAAAKREHPAIAIVDLLLPDISGLEVLDQLASDPATTSVPTLLLSAADLSADDRQRLEGRMAMLARKGDITREAIVAAIRRAAGHAAPVRAPEGAPLVLVIDDHDLNRELVRTLLERQGYRVEMAEDGEAGLAAARRCRPAVVLLDLAMPGMDGFAVARALKADPELRGTPVVALTALAMRGDEERALAAGFDAYLPKPVDRKALGELVRRLAQA